MLYLLVALGFMFFAGIAMTINEGLWNNTVLLICVLIGGCASSVAGVPLGIMVLDKAGLDPARAWYCVFAGYWAVFVVTVILMRLASDKASGIKVRFLPLVDKIGGVVLGLFVATMLTSFAANTLLDAPIRAGEWKKADATAGQRSAFEKAATPFFTVSKYFTEAEGIDVLGR